MKDVGRYLQAGTRENTRRSYQSAIEHFEVTWGGFLPATSDNIVRYLVEYADTLSLSTLKQRLAALAQWHITQGFPDPTKTPTVRQVLKGIRTLHPAQTKQAAPLQLQHLEQAIQWLSREAEQAQQSGNLASLLRSRRDAALLLIGFWRGFRSDELCRLQVEHIQAEAGAGMSLFLPQSKGDRDNLGTTHYVPALKCLCPVQAYLDWISAMRHCPWCSVLSPGSLGAPERRGLASRQPDQLVAPDPTARRYIGRAVHQPFAAPWLRLLGHGKWLGSQGLDDLCRLERHQVCHALHRPRHILWRPCS